ERADADGRRLARQSGQRRPRIGRPRQVVARAEADVVIRAEEAVEADLLGEPRDREQIVVRRALLRLGHDAEAHRPDARHRQTAPPSTSIDSPFTNEALSEHSHTTASAICSGRPSSPVGDVAFIIRSISGSPPMTPRIMGVSVLPGQTAFTRMPDRANSSAAVLVRPRTPCFDAT